MYVMNSDGSEQTYLRNPYIDYYPDWGSTTDGESFLLEYNTIVPAKILSNITHHTINMVGSVGFEPTTSSAPG
jgi:hypothetical protein